MKNMPPWIGSARSLVVGVATVSCMSAYAQTLCEQAYVAVDDAKRFPTVATKISYLESVKNKCTTDPVFQSHLSRYYFEVNRLDEAEATVATGLQLAPRNKELLFGKGDIRLNRQDTDGAKVVASDLIAFYPKWHGGPYLMQRALMDSRQFVEAIKYGDTAIELAKGSVSALYLNNAVASYHAKQDKLCVEYAEAAIARDPGVLKQAWGIDEAIYALDRARRFKEALALAKRRKEADPNWSSDPGLVRILKVMGVVQ